MNPILLMNSLLGGSAETQTQQGGFGQYGGIIMMVALVAVMYFLMIRPQKKRQKEEQELRSAIEIGDEIVTIGGIVGKVVTIRENEIVIETGSDRTKMKLERWAINTNRTKQEQHQKEIEAAKEAAKEKKNSKKDKVDETKKDKVDETK